MGIDVEWHSEDSDLSDWEASRRTLIGDVGDDDEILSDLVSGLNPADYPALGAVDPYGDTHLDSAGAEKLLAEVLRLTSSQPAEIATMLTSVATLLENCIDRPGTFVVFAGD
ncbi:hypothetical protein GCM10020229_23340 [Kitasatospora albolonga]|uniref:hypothetical protein n=1 Tax=Kitasatospora albolonga TaxID=68173 RepID=UPI0031EB166D